MRPLNSIDPEQIWQTPTVFSQRDTLLHFWLWDGDMW